jgi:methylated-DNA-[protein]-cysteine S-methyltransferase
MPETLRLLRDQFVTPIGEIVIAVDCDGNLRVLDWVDHADRMHSLLNRYYGRNGFTIEAAQNPAGITQTLQRYFAGEFSSLEAVPTQTAGTPFQQEVWRSLRQIPCGFNISYAELARRIGRPKAVRAVGLANASNPIGIVVPCHRVIGSGGSLTGYGGGIDRKRWLLQHEGNSNPITCERRR